MRYRTDKDFRKALEERLRQRAENESQPITRLRKRVVFERCIVRLQQYSNSPWVLKGGFALELRLGNMARMTNDMDLTADLDLFEAGTTSLSTVSARLREDLQKENEDRFKFILAEDRKEQLPTQGVTTFRFTVEARLDGRMFEAIKVDVGIGDPLIPPIEEIEASDLLSFAEIPIAIIRATSPAQHFAEKVHALTRPFNDRVNTRVKDLADIMLLLNRGLPDPPTVRQCVQEVFSARATHATPDRIGTPPLTWASSYSAMAGELRLNETTLDEATLRLNDYWTKLF
jgi:predicted nucleotidyltransferase component of viral defense system